MNLYVKKKKFLIICKKNEVFDRLINEIKNNVYKKIYIFIYKKKLFKYIL